VEGTPPTKALSSSDFIFIATTLHLWTSTTKKSPVKERLHEDSPLTRNWLLQWIAKMWESLNLKLSPTGDYREGDIELSDCNFENIVTVFEDHIHRFLFCDYTEEDTIHCANLGLDAILVIPPPTCSFILLFAFVDLVYHDLYIIFYYIVCSEFSETTFTQR
jgi:hypothetical protein